MISVVLQPIERKCGEYLVLRHSQVRGKGERSGVGTADYYSAEFAVDGLTVSYRFKIWKQASKAVSVLVKENSDLLQLLKVGDTLKVKYYSIQSAYPSEWQRTSVRHITWNNQGRLKGHYLVGLEMIENARE
jgi:hypothetical protein